MQDIVRLFDSIITKLNPGIQGKSIVGLESIMNALKVTIFYGTFHTGTSESSDGATMARGS